MFKKVFNSMFFGVAMLLLGCTLALHISESSFSEPITSGVISDFVSVISGEPEKEVSDEWQTIYEQGRLYSDKAGVSVQLYKENSQAVVDAENSAAVLPRYFGSYAIGTPGRASIIGDHNFQSGENLAGLSLGDIINVDTEWGNFRYEIVRKGIATRNIIKDGKASNFIMNDDGLSVFDHCREGNFEGLVIYTCYPFKPGVTNQRYIIFAQLMHE